MKKATVLTLVPEKPSFSEYRKDLNKRRLGLLKTFRFAGEEQVIEACYSHDLTIKEALNVFSELEAGITLNQAFVSVHQERYTKGF